MKKIATLFVLLAVLLSCAACGGTVPPTETAAPEAQTAESAPSAAESAPSATESAPSATESAQSVTDGLPVLPEGVVPVTWEPSPERLCIESDEARELYKNIKAGRYPSLEELKANPVVAQLDALSAYYKALYGNTADIETPEREQLREEILEAFLSLGSARLEGEGESARYAYDGPLQKDFQMELVLGLPASGKSTRVTDPDSEEMGAFIMDCDVIKAMLPEYKESHGCGADAVHSEGTKIMQSAVDRFLQSDMKGVNVILPTVATDIDELFEQYIIPFEDAGYNVRAKFCDAEPNESAARVVARELSGGQLINSAVSFSFGYAPKEVYTELASMTNAFGLPYGYDAEEELPLAA